MCPSYNPFEVLHLDHIDPLRPEINDTMVILLIIDAFSRWVELYPTKASMVVESGSCIFQNFGRFGTPEVDHTDRGTAFHNELVEKLLCTILYYGVFERGERYRGTVQPRITPPPKCYIV